LIWRKQTTRPEAGGSFFGPRGQAVLQGAINRSANADVKLPRSATKE